MNVLPLLGREFSTALRRPVTHRLRMAFGGGSMIVALWALLLSTGTAGPFVLAILVAIAAVLALGVGIFLASDSISRERREGTLSLLLLTDLGPGEVIAGKFAAAGLVPFYTLLAMFPALALCQLIGGVPAGFFWRAMFGLLGTLVFSLSATIYVSSLCEDHRKAYAGATLLLLIVNPLWLCWLALTSGWGGFVLAGLLFGGLSLLFLYAAAVRLAKASRYEASIARRKTTQTQVLSAKPGALLENSPVAWMMLRRRNPHRAWTWLAAGLCVAGLSLVAPSLTTIANAGLYLWLLFAFHLGYQAVLLTRTAYAFYTDQHNGALELILGSPLSNQEIFEGFNRFLLRRSAPLLTIITMADVFYALLMWLNGHGPLAALAIALALTLWITVFGLGWLGVYRSLMMNHPSLAMLATYARLSFVPVVLSLIFLNAPRSDLVKVAVFYVLSAGFLALFFSMDAKSALHQYGRTLLLRPHSEKPPHIENEWSFIDWEESHEEPGDWSFEYAASQQSSRT
jgi:ABC-type transport system involved in multi-copper enzyme maturation permease subunit